MLTGVGGLAAFGVTASMDASAMPQEPEQSDDGTKSTRPRWFLEPQDVDMISWLALPKKERVLDAGCGRGNHLRLFSEQLTQGKVTGVDTNESRIAEIQKWVSEGSIGENASGVAADIRSLPMPNNSFGCVWSSHTMHILPDPIAGVQELVRVCEEGGRVVVREDRFLDRLLPIDVGLEMPGVEDRAVAASAEWFAADRLERGKLPFGWLDVLRQAGLKKVKTKSFLFERQPPFAEGDGLSAGTQNTRIDSRFTQRRGSANPENPC